MVEIVNPIMLSELLCEKPSLNYLLGDRIKKGKLVPYLVKQWAETSDGIKVAIAEEAGPEYDIYKLITKRLQATVFRPEEVTEGIVKFSPLLDQENRPSRFESRVPNWKKWLHLDLWTLNEIYSLLENQEPSPHFVICDRKIVDAVERAIRSGALPCVEIPQKSWLEEGAVLDKQKKGYAVVPLDFVRWALARDMSIPEEMERLIQIVPDAEKIAVGECIGGRFCSDGICLNNDGKPIVKVDISLVSGKSPQTAIINLRERFDDAVVAFILRSHFDGRNGVKKMTLQEIGAVLHSDEDLTCDAYVKFANKLLKGAGVYEIVME